MSCIIRRRSLPHGTGAGLLRGLNISFLYQPPFYGEHKLEGSGQSVSRATAYLSDRPLRYCVLDRHLDGGGGRRHTKLLHLVCWDNVFYFYATVSEDHEGNREIAHRYLRPWRSFEGGSVIFFVVC